MMQQHQATNNLPPVIATFIIDFFLKLFKVNLLEKKRMLLSSMMISHLWLSSNAYPLKSAAKVRLFLQYQAKNPINYCFLLHFYYFC